MNQGRLNWLDSARALLMLLGIPFHVAVVYSLAAKWWVVSPDSSVVLTFFSAVSNTFRMPAFFVVAGFFSFLVLSKKGLGEFLKARGVRLVVPLITALVLLSPLQFALFAWAGTLQVDGQAIARPVFMADGSLDPRVGRFWVAHLWFLIDLVQLTLFTALLAALGLTDAVKRLAQRLQGVGWIGLFLLLGLHLAYSVAWTSFDDFTGHPIPELFWGGVSLHTLFMQGPFFLVGLLFAANRELLFKALRWTPLSLTLSVLALVAAGVVLTLWPVDGTVWQKALRVLLRPLAAWAGFHLVLGACWRWLDVRHPLVQGLVDGAYSIYLFHHPIVALLAVGFCYVQAPVLLEFVTITLVAFGTSWGLHAVLKRYKLDRLLFNGEAGPKPAAQPVAAGLARATE